VPLFFATFLERILQDLISMFLDQRSIGNLTNDYLSYHNQHKGRMWIGRGEELMVG